MMSQWQALKTRWRQLSPREQSLLSIAAGVVALLLAYSLVWAPWQAAREQLRAENGRLRTDLAWLHQLAPQVQALRAQRPAAAATAGPLPVRLDSSLRTAGLGQHLLRLEPAPDGSVRLWLHDAPFDTVIAWLGQLTAQGVVLEVLDMGAGPGPGLVAARVTARD
ncbi:MAG: type II secretion system protein GspM [Immundisolibacter sp.]|uniref:type II secretion system protein GspM n=1 Tax=Immundisolibacter sp. TaxID=1934948 RepID=UPI003EDE8A7A